MDALNNNDVLLEMEVIVVLCVKVCLFVCHTSKGIFSTYQYVFILDFCVLADMVEICMFKLRPFCLPSTIDVGEKTHIRNSMLSPGNRWGF